MTKIIVVLFICTCLFASVTGCAGRHDMEQQIEQATSTPELEELIEETKRLVAELETAVEAQKQAVEEYPSLTSTPSPADGIDWNWDKDNLIEDQQEMQNVIDYIKNDMDSPTPMPPIQADTPLADDTKSSQPETESVYSYGEYIDHGLETIYRCQQAGYHQEAGGIPEDWGIDKYETEWVEFWYCPMSDPKSTYLLELWLQADFFTFDEGVFNMKIAHKDTPEIVDEIVGIWHKEDRNHRTQASTPYSVMNIWCEFGEGLYHGAGRMLLEMIEAEHTFDGEPALHWTPIELQIRQRIAPYSGSGMKPVTETAFMYWYHPDYDTEYEDIIEDAMTPEYYQQIVEEMELD